MRIVHTSDWHAGRTWKGVSRQEEMEAILANLADFIVSQAVDLVLMSGDVFDTGAPAAWAEKAVFGFFKRIGTAGVPSVVIAGNHDNARRLDAWGQLAELVHVHMVGTPRPPDKGGVIEIASRSGERAVVAALPFAAPRRLVTALELAGSDTVAAQGYADNMRRIIAMLCARFRTDGTTVNLLCAHTHLDGAAFTGASERTVHLGEDWAITPQSLPAQAHYIALGHIHRAQRIDAGPPTCYAGSPLQLDFGEEGEEKSFVLIEAHPGRPARIERVPYQGGKALHTITMPLVELTARAEELGAMGWLRVNVVLDRPDVDINRKVRTLLPNAVSVDIHLPAAEEGEERAQALSLGEHAASALFRDYYGRAHQGAEPDPALLRLFEELEAECAGAAGGQ